MVLRRWILPQSNRASQSVLNIVLEITKITLSELPDKYLIFDEQLVASSRTDWWPILKKTWLKKVNQLS